MNKEFKDWLEEKKRVSTYSYLNKGKLIKPSPDIEKELQLVIKKYDELHKPAVIPRYVAEWIIRHRDIYDLYPALRMLENNTFVWGEIYEWYRMNTHKFVNAYLTGEYEVDEEPMYYALVKGHELMGSNLKYWTMGIYQCGLRILERDVDQDLYSNKKTKFEWAELGVNDSNADFEEFDEELH